MQILSSWRALVWLKRLTLAQEQSAKALETLAQIETDRWRAENVRSKPSVKIAYGTLNVEEANKDWDLRKKREALEE